MAVDNDDIFCNLFAEVYRKCFGFRLIEPMSETESKHLSTEILEDTGIVIGAKSIKNYAAYVLDRVANKKENPSLASLDTMSRYVLNAPYTDELTRKEKEGHHPYWFAYKNSYNKRNNTVTDEPDPASVKEDPKTTIEKNQQGLSVSAILATSVIMVLMIVYLFTLYNPGTENFIDRFDATANDSLAKKGWTVINKSDPWWGKHDSVAGHLTLYTLNGDNWRDSVQQPIIRNLLVRPVRQDCFSTEIHLDNFMPVHNWQQAGILLMEDSTVQSRCLRISISYNDYFGGYKKSPEIIIQAVGTSGSDISKPEEIAHIPLFTLAPGEELLVRQNMQKASLRIEKNKGRFRVLYATGAVENFAFREAFSKEINFNPKWIGLFALQGFVNNNDYIPASFNTFVFTGRKCN